MRIKHNPTVGPYVNAQEHSDGDNRCGRKWSCACGACRIARQDKFKPLPLYWVAVKPKHKPL